MKLLMVLHHNSYRSYLNLFTQEVTNTTYEITTALFYLKLKQYHTWKAFCNLHLTIGMTFLI